MKHVWVDTFGIEYEEPKTRIPSEEFKAEERELDELVEFYPIKNNITRFEKKGAVGK